MKKILYFIFAALLLVSCGEKGGKDKVGASLGCGAVATEDTGLSSSMWGIGHSRASLERTGKRLSSPVVET